MLDKACDKPCGSGSEVAPPVEPSEVPKMIPHANPPDTGTPRNALDGYGLGGRKGCVIDLTDPTLRAAAVETGLIWSGPIAAQVQAVVDMAAGRVAVPATYALPEWAANTLAYYAEMGMVRE
jgi:hypothetical protein